MFILGMLLELSLRVQNVRAHGTLPLPVVERNMAATVVRSDEGLVTFCTFVWLDPRVPHLVISVIYKVMLQGRIPVCRTW